MASDSFDVLFRKPLLQSWSLNGDYGRDLTADLNDGHAVALAERGFNHPAWILSHLCLYHDVAADLLAGDAPADPLDHPFGQKSKPLNDPEAYATLAELRLSFADGHAKVAAALQAADQDVLLRPMPVARWGERFPRVGSILIYLLGRHESIHLGQLSAWRRAMGLPRV